MPVENLAKTLDESVEIEVIKFRCPDCRFVWKAAVMPHSPIVSKFKCRQCGHLCEVQVRESFYDNVDLSIEEGKDRQRVAKKVSIISPGLPE